MSIYYRCWDKVSMGIFSKYVTFSKEGTAESVISGSPKTLSWRRKWQLTPVFLPGESQGQGSLVGCHLWGRTESDTTEATQQQQQQDLVWTYCCGLGMCRAAMVSAGSAFEGKTVYS